MPKEPGDTNSRDLEETPEEKTRRQEAETRLSIFAKILNDVENDNLVNLDRTSRIMGSIPKTEENKPTTKIDRKKLEPISNKEALSAMLRHTKEYLEYLTPEMQDQAHKLVIRADLYIADHTATKQFEKKE